MHGGVGRPRHGDARDTCVEHHESGSMGIRPRKQAYVRELLGPLNVLVRNKLSIDVSLSAPKSVSLLGMVGGDVRIVEAQGQRRGARTWP